MVVILPIVGALIAGLLLGAVVGGLLVDRREPSERPRKRGLRLPKKTPDVPERSEDEVVRGFTQVHKEWLFGRERGVRDDEE